MKLSELHQRLSKNQKYRDAYARIGNAVLIAVHFTAARLAARLNRAELATPLGLKTGDVARIEDDFDFSDARAVSLIADRIEGHLESCGVNPQVFFVPGGRIADLAPKQQKPARPINWRLSDFDDAGIPQNRASRLQEEAVTPDQLRILKGVATGNTSRREAVRELVGIGVIQTRAEKLIAILEGLLE